LPKLGIIGPLVGGNPGFVTTIGDKWIPLLRQAGYSVVAASHSVNRYVRLADIAATLVRRRRDIDVLWVLCYGGPSFVVEDIATSIGSLAGIPMVVSLHGGAMPEFAARYPRWTRRVLRRAGALVTPSRYLARCVEGLGFPVRVIPNVVDVAAYPFRRRSRVAPKLFWMRTFHPVWNPEMGVRVLARVRERLPDATLVMAGQDKGLLDPMRRLAAELNVGDAVRFAGFLDMDGKRAAAEAADIFVSTNRVDNQPVAVIEACALGLPVVSTNVGGIPDLLTHGENALLVSDGDVAGMADAIVDLVRRPELALRLSENGRRLATRSAVEAVLPQWAEIFASLAEGRALVLEATS
jgi:glycosyltransferase involved in cell wall biosynthesis